MEDKTNNKNCKKLIIDCDPGCDDALALLLALGGESTYTEINILTTVGNVSVERTTHNAFKIARMFEQSNKTIKICRGSAISMMGTAPNVQSVHGRDGLGDVPYSLYQIAEKSKIVEKKQSAIEFYRYVAGGDDSYHLLCIGPLTNLASAFNLGVSAASFFARIESFVIMGGAFKYQGNITPTAEFNFFFDPVSVQIVLDKFKEYKRGKEYKKLEDADQRRDIVIVPLNATERVQLSWEEIKSLVPDNSKVKEDPIAIWTRCMLQKYFQFHTFTEVDLKESCAKYECITSALNPPHDKLADCEINGENKYSDRKKLIEAANKIGDSGKKHLPKFCYLHDPLAMYYLSHPKPEYTTEVSIRVHAEDDEMRGTVVIVHQKPGLNMGNDNNRYSKGTVVSYLDPNKVKLTYVKEFKKCLLKSCKLPLPLWLK